MRTRAVTAILLLSAACATAKKPLAPPPPPSPAAPAASALPARPPIVPSVPGFDCATVAKTSLACEKPAHDYDRWESTSDVNRALMTRIACAPPPTPKARGAAWDKKSEPENLDKVVRRFGLGAAERKKLFEEGFVVPTRLSFDDYAPALHDVYRSELPVYVSVDAVLHAVYSSNDKTIAMIESSALQPALDSALGVMHAKLASAPGRYTKETAADLDVYLTVARKLLDPTVKSALGNDAAANGLVHRVHAAGGVDTVNLFGRARTIDFAQMRPRGHYAAGAAKRNPGEEDLSSYFRAAMWLSRIEMNLVSRSSRSSQMFVDPRETPREASLAIALVDLAKSAGASEKIAQVNRAWTTLAGPREDVSPDDMERLVDQARITDPAAPDAPDLLRAAIGDRFVRTARTHVQWEGTKDLPVIATMLGPRIQPDTTATRPLVHSDLPGRYEATAIDMAYALGHDRALAYEKEGLAAFPDLRKALDRSRAIVAAPHPEREDLYTSWLAAIRGLAEKPSGVAPSFMAGEAFADMRMNSAIAAFGQLRHNYVLMVPVTYDEAGCEIPDGWVEPATATYRALVEYADRAARATEPFGEQNAAFFHGMGRICRVLLRISERELANEPLTDEEKAFLADITEHVERHSGRGYEAAPRRAGWYYDLFTSHDDALDGAKLVADYFVSSNAGTTRYAGVSEVRLGIFVVDTAGGPRTFVGPVSRAFQARGPIAPRYGDDDVGKFPVDDPWAKSYSVSPARSPAFTLRPSKVDDKYVIDVTSREDVGPLTISLTDHHSVPVSTVKHVVRGAPGKPARVRYVFPEPAYPSQDVASLGIDGIKVEAGDAVYFDRTLQEYDFVMQRDEAWKLGGTIQTHVTPLPYRMHRGRAQRF